MKIVFLDEGGNTNGASLVFLNRAEHEAYKHGKIEMLEVIDERGKVLFLASRKACHTHPELLHREVNALLFNSKGEVFLQKRSMKVDLNPGKYTASAGGHPNAGESDEHAITRELEEELGVKTPLKLVGRLIIRAPTETKRNTLFEGKLGRNPEIKNPDVDAEGSRFMALEEAAKQNNTPALNATLEYYRRQRPEENCKIKAIVLDIGGVVRDSKNALNNAYSIALENAGVKSNFKAEDTWRLRGRQKYSKSRDLLKALYAIAREKTSLSTVLKEGAEKIIPRLEQKHPLQQMDLEKIREDYKKKFKAAQPADMPLINGSVAALKKIKANGWKLGAFSDVSEEVNENWFSHWKISSLFDANLGGDKVRESKPSPEGILKVCQLLEVKPSEMVYIGDREIDVIAARKAGCAKAIVVLTGMASEEELKKANADLVCRDLLEAVEKLSALKND